MAHPTSETTPRYDAAAPRWRDKMRALGYYDAYLGFLSSPRSSPVAGLSVIDIGAGTAAFAEAWVAIYGPPEEMTLLDPSSAMLKRGQAALRARSVEPTLIQNALGSTAQNSADIALAAHVLEHCDDPLTALEQMRNHLRPRGRLYLVVSKPHWCNVIIWLQWRHRTFSEDEITGLLQTAGFEIERLYSFPSGPPSRTSRGIVAIRPD